MKSWVPYVVVGVLGAGAGVLVAGLPERGSSSTTLAIDGASTTTAATSAPTTTAAPTTEQAASAPTVVNETLAATTAAPSTSAPPATTAAPAPTEAATTPPTTAAPPSVDRSAVGVVVANGTIIGGVAGRTAETLRNLGWTSVETGDGSEPFGQSVVYFVDGFGDAANLLVADLGLDGIFVLPIADAPALVGSFPNLQVLLYVGQEQA